MSKLTQPIKWHGGKHYLAPKIIQLMPRHLHYVEPYAGGLSVLLARDPDDESLWWSDKTGERGVSEVVNDIQSELMHFWEVLQDRRLLAAFKRIIEATPFSEELFNRLSRTGQGVNKVDSALRFFVRYRQSRQGLGKDFATLSRNRTRRGINEQASSWLTAIEGLPDVHDRLKGVVILNRPALDVIRQQDGPKTLFYCDPPYLHETRSSTGEYGEYEMTEEDHRDLLATLSEIQGRFMLSGYRSPLYDDRATFYGWHRADVDLPNNASGKKKKERKTECVWMNYNPTERTP